MNPRGLEPVPGAKRPDRVESNVDWTSGLMLGLVVVVALLSFLWPLLVVPSAALDGNALSPFIFAVLLPIVIGIVVSQLSRGTIDPKTLAMLGPTFGFLLGSTTLLTSSLLTGGVGPWLPFQMMAASFVGMGAGLLPGGHRAKPGSRPAHGSWAEIALLGAYGAVATTLYGALVDLTFWPFNLGLSTELSYVAGAPILENLHRFLLWNAATAMGWNLGRAVTTIVTLAIVGRPLLRILRRTNRRATFAPG